MLLKTAGFSAASDATKVSVLIGVFKVCDLNFSSGKWEQIQVLLYVILFMYLQLVMTGIAVVQVDKLGRKPLLIGGVSGIVCD